MVAEAIRISIAEDEDRRRKEEKESKAAKKDEERKRKEDEKAAKKAAKASRKSMLYPLNWNSSSTSHLATGESSAQTGKGKSVDRSYDDSSSVPTSPKENPQQHLEFSRTHIQPSPTAESGGHGTLPTEAMPIREPQPHRHALRKLSVASSSGSSVTEPFHPHDSMGASSSLDPSPNTSGLNLDRGGSAFRSETPPGESLFNFRSLAAVIDVGSPGDSKNGTTERVEETTVIAATERPLTASQVTSPALPGTGTSTTPSTAVSTAASTPPIIDQVGQNAGEGRTQERSKSGTTQTVVEDKTREEESMRN
jgi:hypothetical protein